MDTPTFDGIDLHEWQRQQPLEPEGTPTLQIATIGIDLAKNVLQIHGADQRGKAVLRQHLKRDQVERFFANLPPYLIGTEACSSAYHWARKLQALGHVRSTGSVHGVRNTGAGLWVFVAVVSPSESGYRLV